MPSRARAVGDRPAMSAPPTRITPAIGRTSPEIAAQRGRLAGPVGTEQGDHLAGADVQVEIPHDRGRVVARRQPVELEHGDGLQAHLATRSISLAAEPR